MLTPNKLIFIFGSIYVFANFGEKRSRNVTVRVHTDGKTDAQMQTGFIICPILCATAMKQNITQHPSQTFTALLLFIHKD